MLEFIVFLQNITGSSISRSGDAHTTPFGGQVGGGLDGRTRHSRILKLWEYESGSPVRAGTAFDRGTVYFGDIAGWLYAVGAKTGALRWKQRIDSHPDAVVTSSPKIYQDRLYIGVASHEEGMAPREKGCACCTFRGGVAAFDTKTGKLVWRFYTIPEEITKLGVDAAGIHIMGPAGGVLYVGSGYTFLRVGKPNNKLYAFSLDGQ